MRKITLFLMSLFLTVGAMAQSPINFANFDASKTYRIYNKATDKGDTEWKAMSYSNQRGCLKSYNVADVSLNWQFVSAGENQYKIYNVESQKYLGAVGGNSGVGMVNENEATVYNVEANSEGTKVKFWHTDSNPRNCLWNDGNNNLYGWSENTHEWWYLEEVYVAPTYETEEVGNPTVDGVYRVYWKGQERGYLAYHNDYPTKPVLADVNLSGHNGIDKHYKSTEDGVQREWYLITSDSGKKYLFSPYTGKFLTYSKDAADSGKGALYDTNRPLEIAVESNTHTDWNRYYILTATIDDVKYLLSSGCGTASRGANAGYPVRWAKAEGDGGQMHDGGSPLTFVKVIDFPVEDAILAQAEAAINDYENPVEDDVNFEWTTSTPWTAVEHSAYYTSTVFNDNELDGVKFIEGEVTVGGARTATVTFTYIDGGHKLNIRGVEVIDAMGNIVAGDYHVGIAGSSENTTGNVYTVNVAEAGTYKVRCYAAEGGGDQFNSSHGSIVVSFAKLNVIDLTKTVTFAAEYSTLYLGYKVAIPAGVEAYVLSSIESGYAILTQVVDVIPANTAVILKKTATANEYNFYYTSDDADEIELNYLEGSIVDRYVQGDAYVLGIPEGETEPCLCPALLNKVNNTSFKNNANKAYLKVAPGAAMSTSLRFDFDGTTGVEEVETEVAETVIYDLTGRRVNEITKSGVYIVNGRKVLVK